MTGGRDDQSPSYVDEGEGLELSKETLEDLDAPKHAADAAKGGNTYRCEGPRTGDCGGSVY